MSQGAFLVRLLCMGIQLEAVMGKSQYGTSGGLELTDELIQRLAIEAEGGYSIKQLQTRRRGESMDRNRDKRHDDEEEDAGTILTPGAGKLGFDTQFDPTIGIGNGVAIDVTDGSLVIGGFDTDGQ